LTTISAVQRQVGLRPGRGGAAPGVVWLLRAVGSRVAAAGGGDELLLDLRWARRRGAQSTIEHQHAVGATTQSSLHTLLFAAAFSHTQIPVEAW